MRKGLQYTRRFESKYLCKEHDFFCFMFFSDCRSLCYAIFISIYPPNTIDNSSVQYPLRIFLWGFRTSHSSQPAGLLAKVAYQGRVLTVLKINVMLSGLYIFVFKGIVFCP